MGANRMAPDITGCTSVILNRLRYYAEGKKRSMKLLIPHHNLVPSDFERLSIFTEVNLVQVGGFRVSASIIPVKHFL